MRFARSLLISMAAGLTGLGHNIDRALLLGRGRASRRIDIETIDRRVAAINERELTLHGRAGSVRRGPRSCFTGRAAVRTAFDSRRATAPGRRCSVASITDWRWLRRDRGSGGWSCCSATPVPFDFHTAAGCRLRRRQRLTIAQIVRANERAIDPSRDIDAALLEIWAAMSQCIARGLRTGGLPGPLRVKRRAKGLPRSSSGCLTRILSVLDWVSVWAMAVNEENAAGGRVVTAPTNGALAKLGVPLRRYIDGASPQGVATFLPDRDGDRRALQDQRVDLGCRDRMPGKVGVACDGRRRPCRRTRRTNAQMERRRDGIEHHLGMTCDPVSDASDSVHRA